MGEGAKRPMGNYMMLTMGDPLIPIRGLLIVGGSVTLP